MPRGSSVEKDNSTESQAVSTIEKGFNLTIFYSSADEKIAQFTATPGCNVYTDIVRRSICLHNYDVLDDFTFISAVSFKLIK